MIIGFTGTREKLSERQLSWLYETLETGQRDGTIATVHHGARVGADATCHRACLGMEIPVHVWPPTDTKYLAAECLTEHELVTVHPAMPYLNRDREIVSASYGLIALPFKREDDGGGTWYTVHFAQRMNKPVIICYADGRREERYPAPMRYEGTQHGTV